MICLENKNTPYFCHAPGRMELNFQWNDFLFYSKINPLYTKKPEDLTIVTFMSSGKEIGYNSKRLQTFGNSLKRSNCEYATLISEGVWNNTKKIKLLKDHSKKIDTKYTLVADSSDVLLLRKLDHLIKDFESFNRKAVFNSEKQNRWPPDLDPEVVEYENTLNTKMFLNAGLWMTETDFLAELLSNPMPKVKSSSRHLYSEQRFYKHALLKYKKEIGVDFNNKLFVGLNRNEEKIFWPKFF